MQYREALDWLYSLTNYEQRKPVTYSAQTLDLDRMRALLAMLGTPQARFKSIHIAGTKGKGSTAAMLASVLQKNGAKTGLYTSPHLHTFRERIRVDGRMIETGAVEALAGAVRAASETLSARGITGITTFEAVTAMGFLHFAHENVEWAAVEVGLGGRLDATNVTTPSVCVITALSYDHMDWLGKTLAEIAAEKGGIIKPGVPVVIHPQLPEASAVLDRIAHERNAPAAWLGRHWRWTTPSTAATRGVQTDLPAPTSALALQQFQVQRVAQVRSKDKPFLSDLEGWYEIPLLGKHQLDNATAVVAVMHELRGLGVVVSARAVHEGLRSVSWAGRFEVLRGEPPLVVDGAHNVDSVNKLAATLAETFPGRRWTFVFGCLADKDAEGMLRALKPRAARWVMTRSESARALPVERLMALARDLNLRATPANDMAEALRQVDGAPEAVCVTGSLTLVADARVAWTGAEGRWIEQDPKGL